MDKNTPNIYENENSISNQEENINKNFYRRRSTNEEIKNNLLININEYKLNLYSLINKINSSKKIFSKRKENEYILNQLLISSKLNKSTKLLSFLLIFYLNKEDKNQVHYLNYLFSRIIKLSSELNCNLDLENYIFSKDSSFLIDQNNLFYSKNNIFKLKQMINSKNSELNKTIDNLIKDINKNIKIYLDQRKNEFLNRAIMDDNRMNQLDTIINKLCNGKMDISENAEVFYINKKWIFKTKLFLDTLINARKGDVENLLLEEYFSIDKVYSSFLGKQNNSKLKNYYGIVFPGPINNYELIDMKDYWIDPIDSEENILIDKNVVLNEDYCLLEENDWNFLKDIFGVTNEIKRNKIDEQLYKNKIIIFEPRLRLEENKNFLKKRIIQINSNSTVKDFKIKIIRCLNYEINRVDYNNKSLYEENDVVFFAINKKNRDLLIEMCIAFTHNNKIYDSLYIQQIKTDNNEELIKNVFNNYNQKNYYLIAEIVSKNNKKRFIHPIISELDIRNIYNCSVCGEQLNFIEKYNCDLCNLSFYCSKECANTSGEHKILHEYLNKIYIKKFDIKPFLEERIQSKDKNALKGCIGLERNKSSSCINSIIQILSNTKDLTKYFLNNNYMNDINIIDSLTTKDTLVNKYINLIREMWMGTKGNKKDKNLEIFHKEFIQLLIKKIKIETNNNNPNFNNILEILKFILLEFHNELNRYINTEKIVNQEYNEEYGIEDDIKKDNSIINDLFRGIYQSSLSCSRCGNVSMIYDFFLYILLPIPKKNNNLIIKYFSEFECKNMRYVMDETSTIKSLKDKAIKNISDKISHLLHIMSLTELIDVTAFDNEDEKVLTYTAMYNSLELVQFDKNKVLTKVYSTQIQPEESTTTPKEGNEDKNIKKEENNDFNIYLSKIFRDNNDAELVFYEKSVIDRECINIYVYPFIFDDKEKDDKSNKYKDKLFNVYPIAVSVKLSLILDNLQYAVNVRLRDILLDHFKEESERLDKIYIELSYPHYFCNSSFYSQANCLLCKEKKKNSLFCDLFSYIDRNKTIKDLMNLFEYPKQPIIFLARCKYYDTKKQIYSNMNSFPLDTPIKKSQDNKLDIYDCFEIYTKKESLNDMEWPCESCNSNQIPEKQLLIYKPPLYLIIQFDRFSFRKSLSIFNNYGIDDSLITFPINKLDLGEYVEGPDKNKAKYNLYGAIYREISVKSDYIYAVCKNNKQWIMYKDSKVGVAKEIVNKNAHFLFYKRQDIND